MSTSVSIDKPWVKHYLSPIRPEIDSVPFRNLPEMIRKSSEEYDKRIAFLTCMPNGMNGSLTFKQADQMSDAFAIYLREKLGLKAGDRVAVQMPNSLSYPIAIFGILKAGCVLVNTNPLYTSSEMKHQFRDADVKAVVIVNMFADKLEPILKELGIKHVILSQVSDFFPRAVGGVISLIQKYWNKQIPAVKFENTRFRQAIRWGEKHRDIAKLTSYLDGVDQNSLAALQYTGGTTGVSKGAMLTHLNLMANTLQALEMLQEKIETGKECVMTALPLYHIFAFSVNLMMFYYIGGKNILIPSPRPLANLKRAFENYEITWLTAVNTLLNGLCNEVWFTDSPPKTLKATAAGGMALHSAVAKKWEEVTNSRAIEGYGLTETSPILTFNPIEGLTKPDSIGIPTPSTDVKCVDEEGNRLPAGEAGEIWAKGPQVMPGYLGQEEETKNVLTADGWFKTGDIGVMDEDGFFKIVDRKKDMILVSGFNVFPNEIEDCLAKHEKISESAVIGVPDEKSSETVKAFIVKKDASLTQEEVIAHCKEHLTGYKIPKQIEFREDLPKSPIGKILRKELRK
jgi:long-chain acyl-CoA synthetase